MPDFAARRTMMVDTQVRPSDVTKFPIIEAMLQIPREEFVPASQREAAYVGENLDLGDGRVVLEPRSFAKILDALSIQADELVLDVACGYGYSAAVIARLAEAVVAVEDDADMAREAQETLLDQDADNVVVHNGPLAEGAAEHAPFDVIVIEGGVAQVPAGLIDQLKDGGRIAAIVMNGALGEARIGYKLDGKMTWRLAFNGSAPVLPGFETDTEFAL